MGYTLPRHKFQLYMIVVLIFITWASGGYWKYWFVAPFSAFFLYIVGKFTFHINSRCF
jgi:hypothetical protein